MNKPKSRSASVSELFGAETRGAAPVWNACGHVSVPKRCTHSTEEWVALRDGTLLNGLLHLRFRQGSEVQAALVVDDRPCDLFTAGAGVTDLSLELVVRRGQRVRMMLFAENDVSLHLGWGFLFA